MICSVDANNIRQLSPPPRNIPGMRGRTSVLVIFFYRIGYIDLKGHAPMALGTPFQERLHGLYHLWMGTNAVYSQVCNLLLHIIWTSR